MILSETIKKATLWWLFSFNSTKNFINDFISSIFVVRNYYYDENCYIKKGHN
jgi:hypothetical protein